MKYKESRWEIKRIDGRWRTTHFYTTVNGTIGHLYLEFETESEALLYMLRWS